MRGHNTNVAKRLIIAIDGPSGAGKGTVARAVAARLGYRHIDTGAMYRAIAWKATHDGIDLTNEAAGAAPRGGARLGPGGRRGGGGGPQGPPPRRPPGGEKAA